MARNASSITKKRSFDVTLSVKNRTKKVKQNTFTPASTTENTVSLVKSDSLLSWARNALNTLLNQREIRSADKKNQSVTYGAKSHPFLTFATCNK